MRTVIIIALFILSLSEVMGQNFNFRNRYERPSALFTQLIVHDSSIITIGTTSSLELPHTAGLILTEYSYDGVLLDTLFLANSDAHRNFFFPNLTFLNDSLFMVNGNLSNDTISLAPYLLKMHLDGTVIWEKPYQYGPEPFFFKNKAALHHNDKIYLANRIILPGQEESMNIQIIDIDGNLLANKFIQLEDWGSVACAEVWGDKIILGGVRIIGPPNEPGHSIESLLVAIGLDGEKLWEWTYEDSNSSGQIQDVLITDKGNLLIAHSRVEKVIVNPSTCGYKAAEYRLTELTPQMIPVWQTTFDDATNILSGYEKFTKLHKCQDNSGYLASGSIYVEGPDQTGDVLGYLAKVSLTGDSLWTRNVLYYENESDLDSLSPFVHTIYDMDETPTGDILIAGEAYESDLYPQQAWVAKVDEYGCHIPGCHLIDATDELTENLEWLVYPNPTPNDLYVYLPEFKAKQHSQLMLYDISGKLLKVLDANYGNTNYIIPMDGMNSGNYILSWMIDGQKIVFEKLMLID